MSGRSTDGDNLNNSSHALFGVNRRSFKSACPQSLTVLHFLFVFLFIPFTGIVFAFFLSPSPILVVTHIRGHYAGSSAPPPNSTRLRFYREKGTTLSFLVESRRLLLAHARRLSAVDLVRNKKTMVLIVGIVVVP